MATSSLFPAAAPFPPVRCHRAPPPPPLSPSARPFQPSRVILVQWLPPPPGCFKLNFDGSVFHDGSGRASIGGAIRDAGGRILLAFAEPTEHSTVGIVEARAMIRGLRLALDMGLQQVVAEGDDLMLVKLLRGEDTQTRIPMALQEEIVGLLLGFTECDVRHVYREGNQVAHTLCRQAYHSPGVWFGFVPAVVFDKAEEDRRGVLHERQVVRRPRDCRIDAEHGTAWRWCCRCTVHVRQNRGRRSDGQGHRGVNNLCKRRRTTTRIKNGSRKRA